VYLDSHVLDSIVQQQYGALLRHPGGQRRFLLEAMETAVLTTSLTLNGLTGIASSQLNRPRGHQHRHLIAVAAVPATGGWKGVAAARGEGAALAGQRPILTTAVAAQAVDHLAGRE